MSVAPSSPFLSSAAAHARHRHVDVNRPIKAVIDQSRRIKKKLAEIYPQWNGVAVVGKGGVSQYKCDRFSPFFSSVGLRNRQLFVKGTTSKKEF